MTNWTTQSDLRQAVQREWESGRLLAARVPAATTGTAAGPTNLPPADEQRAEGANGQPAWPSGTEFPLRIRVRRPSAAELVDRWDEARNWVETLSVGAHFRLEYQDVPHRTLGRQRLPVAAVFDNPSAALRLIGRARAAAGFDVLVAATPVPYHAWLASHPLIALDIADDWTAVLAVAAWLGSTGAPGCHLREVDLPGVHTKIIERHRRVIAELVESAEPGRWSATTGPHWFTDRFGFLRKPVFVRVRALDPRCELLPGVADLALPVAELARLRPPARRVVVTENEVNHLTFPPLPGGLVLFGSGNEAASILAALPWLAEVPVHYWGDIDTHGLAILDRVRARVPHVASLLMDRETLFAHRDAWVEEATPARGDPAHLSPAERDLYDKLRGDVYGTRVRLEQEHVRYGHVREVVERLGDG